MDIISITNSALRYHKSASNLAVVKEYKNVQDHDISTSFAILSTSNSFICWNRIHTKNKEDDSRFEMWRLKNDELDKINKIKSSGISAFAGSNPIAKSSTVSFAIGSLNGNVKVFNLGGTGIKLAHTFKPAMQLSSVIYLDYNCNNENIASVRENGTVDILSLNTGVKYDTIKLDGASTLARFHPTKRSNLGIASYQGSVAYYDIFAKKSIFRVNPAHSAPCVDIALTENSMLTCGYDAAINIYDTRKKKIGLSIKGTYGWTSITMSTCGYYLVGGNMKGELISYDMRNMQKVLASARVESGNHKITRVEFLQKSVGNVEEPISAYIDFAEKESLDDPNDEDHLHSDSFTDMLNYQRGRISDFSSNVNQAPRDSNASRPSNDFIPNKIVDFDSPEKAISEDIPKNRLYNKRRSSLKTSMLQHIHEEQFDKENDSKFMNTPRGGQSGSRNTSTPALKVTFEEAEDEVIEVDNESLVEPTDDTPLQNSEPLKESSAISFDLKKEFENLEKRLCEKIHLEVGSMNFDEENRYIKVMSQIVDQRMRLQERVNMIEESMRLLLNDDFKINRIMDLQAENDELRAQNQELLRFINR